MGIRQDYMLSEFKRDILQNYAIFARQIGVKEIKHEGWQNYIRHFLSMRVVMLGRDPRDVKISYFKKWQRKNIFWQGPFDPESVAAFFNRQFQLALRNMTECMTVR